MKKIIENVYKAQTKIGVLCISIFFLAILVQVFCRYAGITVVWTGEVSTYSFIWAVFMGASIMTFEDKHFAFSMFVDKLKDVNKEILKLFIVILILVFSIAVLYYGVIISKTFWNYTWISLPKVKMGYTWLCVPILGATNVLYCIYHIFTILENIKNIKKGGNK